MFEGARRADNALSLGRICSLFSPALVAVCAVLLAACGSTADAGDPDASPDAEPAIDSGTLADSGPGTDGGPPPGEWQLPADAFTPARMPMTLVHPRDADTPAWVYAKNAYPGLRWEIPIVVQGGAWPFQYRIVDDGGARGISVGRELARSEEAGFVVHRLTPEYGVISWKEPVAGTYGIELQVTDQEGGTLQVPISLTVGIDGWVFIDADRGNDTTGDGTVEAPFATLTGMHGDVNGTDWAGHRVYIAGTVALDGNQPSGNLRIEPGHAPAVWVGLPGRDAVLQAHEGKFVVASPDFYLANIEYRDRVDYVPDNGSFLHMLTVWDAARFTIHDVLFSRFQGVPVNAGLGNSGVMMFTRVAPVRPYVAVVNCEITGPSGVFTSAYALRNAVFEKNRWHDADFSLSDGSVAGIIYVKADNENITIRANTMAAGNVWAGLSGIAINEAKLIEIAHNTVDTPYDTGRAGSIRLFVNAPNAGYSWTTDTPVWVDRNSVRKRIFWEGEALVDMADGAVHIERNVVSPGAIPTSSRIVATDNGSGDDFFGSDMLLTGAARDMHIGRRGAEIAVPL